MPRYYDERDRYRRGSMGYAPQVGGIDYIPRTDLGMADRMGQILQQRQERHDHYSHMLSEAMAEFGSMPAPLSDTGEVDKWMEHIDEDLKRRVKEEYGGDYGLAGKDIVSRLARHRRTAAQVAREAEEEHRQRQIYDQLRIQNKLAGQFTGEYDEEGRPITADVNPFRDGIFRFEDGQLVQTQERDYGSIRERSDYDSWVARISKPLAEQVRSELFKRADSPELSDAERGLYWQDDTIRGLSDDEIDKLIDEGVILTDDTVRRFLEDTSFDFEYGPDIETARNFMAQTLKDQVSQSVQSSVRQDPVGMEARRAAEEEDKSKYMSVAGVTSALQRHAKSFGIKSAKGLHDKMQELKQEGDVTSARRLEDYLEAVGNRVLYDKPQYMDTLEANPSEQFIQNLEDKGFNPEFVEILQKGMMRLMDSEHSSFEKIRNFDRKKFTERVTRLRERYPGFSLEDGTDKILERKTTEEEIFAGLFKDILLDASRDDPELFEKLFHVSYGVSWKQLDAALGRLATSWLPGGTPYNPADVVTSVVQSVVGKEHAEVSELGRALYNNIREFGDYYSGAGNYEDIDGYRSYVKEKNKFIAGEEDITEDAYTYDIHHQNEMRNVIAAMERNIQTAFEIPDEWLTKRGALDPEFHNVEWNNVLLLAGHQDIMPTFRLLGRKDSGETVTFDARPKTTGGFDIFKDITEDLGIPEAYHRGLGSVVGAIPTKGMSVQSVFDAIQGKNAFKSMFRDDASMYNTHIIKNINTKDNPIYTIEEKSTGNVMYFDEEQFSTDDKFIALKLLFNAVEGATGSRFFDYEELLLTR